MFKNALAAAAAACLLVCAAPALAADPIANVIAAASPAAGTTIDLGSAWATIAPILGTALGAVATAIIGVLAAKAQQVLHVSIEQKYRDSLHSAAETGINLAVSKLGGIVGGYHPDVKNALVAMAVNWTLRSVPDALKYLGVSQATVETLVESKVEKLLGFSAGTAAVAANASEPLVDTPAGEPASATTATAAAA